VVLPQNADQVSKTVITARKFKVPFVVACGRHSTGASSSAAEDGIVLDLRRLRKVTVDPQSKTITAEGGCNWQDVDEAAAKHGLATVGGLYIVSNILRQYGLTTLQVLSTTRALAVSR
jgi:FAD/FMN-containing dehydrogenase